MWKPYRITQQVAAVQWDGSTFTAAEIIKENSAQFWYSEDRGLYFRAHPHATYSKVPLGRYIVKDAFGAFRILPAAYFTNTYEGV